MQPKTMLDHSQALRDLAMGLVGFPGVHIEFPECGVFSVTYHSVQPESVTIHEWVVMFSEESGYSLMYGEVHGIVEIVRHIADRLRVIK